jgi:hypothetical protein
MLGRYFQLAALSIYFSIKPSKLRSLYGVLDKGVSLTNSELVDLVEASRDLLLEKYGLKEYDPCKLLESMNKDSPRAYTNDKEVFSELYFPSFNYEACPSRRKGKKAGIFYPEIAVSFIEETLSKKGVITPKNVKRKPALFGSFIFSEDKLRGLTGRTLHDNISLVIGILGVIVSYAGRIPVGPEESLELFLLPDGSIESLMYSLLMYGLLFKGNINSWKNLAKSLVDLPSTSIERALIMASSVKFSSARDEDLRQLTNSWLPEKFILLRVKPERRPNISGSTTLTSRFIASSRDIAVVRAFERMIDAIQGLKNKEKDKVLAAVGDCVNYLTEAYFTNNKTLLVECARLLIPLHQDEDLPVKVREAIALFVEVLANDIR